MDSINEEVKITEEDMSYILNADSPNGFPAYLWPRIKVLVRRLKAAERFIEGMEILGMEDATYEIEDRYYQWREAAGK